MELSSSFQLHARAAVIFYTEVPSPEVCGREEQGAAQRVLHVGEPEPTDIAVAKDGRLYWIAESSAHWFGRVQVWICALLGPVDSYIGFESPAQAACDVRPRRHAPARVFPLSITPTRITYSIHGYGSWLSRTASKAMKRPRRESIYFSCALV